jgi:hypothetical protein
LFQNYVLDYCLTHSLVGKIWLMWDWSDTQVAQPLFESFAQGYTLTDNQKNTKKFQQPWARWTKEVQMWKYFLTTLSYSDPLVNRTVKHDLRYFKDAGVDTIIPLNYGYFNYQNTIVKFCNYKKCRFHKLEKLEQCFLMSSWAVAKDLSDDKNSSIQSQNDKYAVTVLYTGQKELLQRQKKVMRPLQRGKNTQIVREKI